MSDRFPTADERWPRQGIVMTKEEEDRDGEPDGPDI